MRLPSTFVLSLNEEKEEEKEKEKEEEEEEEKHLSYWLLLARARVNSTSNFINENKIPYSITKTCIFNLK